MVALDERAPKIVVVAVKEERHGRFPFGVLLNERIGLMKEPVQRKSVRLPTGRYPIY
ncbi:hypothetical protein GCM10009748_27300 [Agromyces lapidis]